jgi:hypothetical protein
MSKALTALGFQVREYVNVNRDQMMVAAIDFGRRLRDSGGIGLFYYSGHGLQVSGKNYLVPLGAKLDDVAYVEVQTLSADDVLAAMDSAHNGANIMVLDACRNNPFVTSFKSIERGLTFIGKAPQGTLIAYATAPNEVAEDGTGKCGTYTCALLKNLPEPGLTVEEMLKHTAADVMRSSGNKQSPWFAESLTETLCLNGSDMSVPVKLAREALERHDPASAARILAAALSQPGCNSSAAEEEANKLFGEVLPTVGQYDVNVVPEEATLSVNGEPVIVVNKALLLNPGTYELEARRAGYLPERKRLRVVGGNNGVLDFTLREDWKPWALMGTGGALLIAGSVTGAMSLAAHAKLLGECTNMLCPPNTSFDWQAESHRGQSLALTTDILLGTGAAIAAAGVGLWYFVDRPRIETGSAPGVESSIGCSPGGCTGTMTVRY